MVGIHRPAKFWIAHLDIYRSYSQAAERRRQLASPCLAIYHVHLNRLPVSLRRRSEPLLQADGESRRQVPGAP